MFQRRGKHVLKWATKYATIKGKNMLSCGDIFFDLKEATMIITLKGHLIERPPKLSCAKMSVY